MAAQPCAVRSGSKFADTCRDRDRRPADGVERRCERRIQAATVFTGPTGSLSGDNRGDGCKETGAITEDRREFLFEPRGNPASVCVVLDAKDPAGQHIRSGTGPDEGIVLS